MKNYKLLTLRVVPKQRDFKLIFEQKVIKETKITINGKIVVWGA